MSSAPDAFFTPQTRLLAEILSKLDEFKPCIEYCKRQNAQHLQRLKEEWFRVAMMPKTPDVVRAWNAKIRESNDNPDVYEAAISAMMRPPQ